MSRSPEQIRETLLKAAREAGERYIHVRGVDLVAAIVGSLADQQLPAKTVSDKKAH